MKPPRKSENAKSNADRATRGKIIAFLEKNRGKPQYRPTPSASTATNRVMRRLSKQFGPGANALQSHWPQIIGEKWAKVSRPAHVRGSKDGKTLTIIAQGPAATLIQANSGQLLDKINQFLGAGAISKLRVQQGQIQKQAEPHANKTNDQDASHLRSTLAQPASNALEEALNQLGRKILDKEPR